MNSFDFNQFSSSGFGAESFALLEEDLDTPEEDSESVAEAEVKISVDTEDEKRDDETADEAANSTETVADVGAELFKDIQNLYALKHTLTYHPLHPSLYEYINGDGQLDKLLQVSLPSVESLSSNSDNVDLKATLIDRIDKLFSDGINDTKSLKSHISNFFNLLCYKLQKMQAATDTVVCNRRARIGDLIFRMEDEAIPEDTVVNTNNETEPAPESDNDNDQNNTDSEHTEAPEDTSSDDNSTETVNTSANTAEECNKLMKAIGVEHLTQKSDIIQCIENSVNGDANSFKMLTDFTRKAARELAQFRHNGSVKRMVRYNKYNVKTALENYYSMLDNWSNVNMMHYGIGQIAKQAKSITMRGADDTAAILPLFHTAMMLHNYLQSSKKAMDALYFNLQFAATKLSKKRYRK